MPKRTDIKSILLIGSGPIVIGQACEFDYSGTQACKALREEGFKVILINSNPATIMTDPELADRTYVEPITLEVVEKVIERERPDALLPTMGGQTALNATMGLVKRGVLEKYGVKLIGASAEAIHKAEDREAFKQAMQRIGLTVPESGTAHNRDEAARILEKVGFPAIIRPSFTMGGTGGNIAWVCAGPVTIQPSEFVKVSLVLWLGAVLAAVVMMLVYFLRLEHFVGFAAGLGHELLALLDHPACMPHFLGHAVQHLFEQRDEFVAVDARRRRQRHRRRLSDAIDGHLQQRLGIADITVGGANVGVRIVVVVGAHAAPPPFCGNHSARAAATGAGTSDVTSPPNWAISRMNRLLMDTSAGLHGR